MADRNSITTLTESNDNATDQDYTFVTGTDVTTFTGTKRTLNTYSLSNTVANIMPLLYGTLPAVNFDQIKQNSQPDGSIVFDFYYQLSPVFTITVEDPYGDFIATITDTTGDRQLLESGFDKLLESGDLRLLEGA